MFIFVAMGSLIGLQVYFVFSFILRLVIFFYITRIAMNSKLLQFYLLGIHVFIEGIMSLLFSFLPQVLLFFYLPDALLMIIFIYLTFHRDKIFPLIMLSSIAITSEILTLIFYGTIDIIFHYINCFIIGAWLTYHSLKSYIILKNFRSIEPWIISRYIFIIFYGFILMIVNLLSMLDPSMFNLSILYHITIVSLLVMIIYIALPLLEYLAWGMPEKLKMWFNRNYKPFEEKVLSKVELNEMIEFLADFLALRLSLSPTAARGLLKLAIQEELGKFKQMKQVHYRELRIVIMNSLQRRLERLKADGKVEIGELNRIIQETLKKLDEGQSLITMSNF